MGKDEASDLKSLIERRVQCELELQKAQQALREASHQLERWIHKQQYPTVN